MIEQPRVTIREIARSCGVSTQTVSRVLNGRPDVAPATRSRVEAAIVALDFQPSAAARSLARGRSGMLGVVVAGLRYFGVAELLNSIADEAADAGYAILLKEIPIDDRAAARAALDFLMSQGVEGIITAATDLATEATALPPTTPPIVSLKSVGPSAWASVLVDDRGGARTATTHLLLTGRRRIGLLAGPDTSREAAERGAGWREAIETAGATPGPVIAGDWTSSSGERAMASLLTGDPRIEGVFVANDQMAIGALRAAYRQGIRIPDDVAVVGYDGLEEGAQAIPALTTIVQPLLELGTLGVRCLIEAIDATGGRPDAPRVTVLEPTLLVRESSGAAA